MSAKVKAGDIFEYSNPHSSRYTGIGVVLRVEEDGVHKVRWISCPPEGDWVTYASESSMTVLVAAP